MRVMINQIPTLGIKTGIGHYTAELLAALRRCAPEHTYSEINWGREVTMRLDRRLRWQQWETPRRARALKANLLHSPGFDAPLWKPCRNVLTVHDLIGALFPQNFPPVSRFYWSRWLPFTLRAADAIIADSESTRRDIERLARIPSDRIQVISLGVDSRFAPASPDSVAVVRERYHLPSRFVLYVGTLEPRKGIDTLLEAFARLTPEAAEALVLTGQRGWRVEPLLKRLNDPALRGRVQLLDYVPDADLPALYSAASVLTLPSRYEGFGLPVLEAMACGTPVVCSNASSLPEIAGDAALRLPPDDVAALSEALNAVLMNLALAADLREKGLRRAKRFTWEDTARQTLDVYKQIVDGR